MPYRAHLVVQEFALEHMIGSYLEHGKFSEATDFAYKLFHRMAHDYRLHLEAEPTRRFLDVSLAERLDILRESAALKLFARAKEHAAHGQYNHDVKEPLHRTVVKRASEVMLAPIAGYTSQTQRFAWMPRAVLQLDVLYECNIAFAKK